MGLLDQFVQRATRGQSSGPYALNAEDRKAIGRQGLLRAGLTMLAAPSNGTQGIASGLLAGAQGIQEDAGQLVNDRYRTDVMERTRAQMGANTAREQAMRGVLNPDGTLNQDGFGAFAQIDPLEALQLRARIEELTAPKPFTPNPTRTRIAGRQEIQEEFDPRTGQWSQIGVGERWGNSPGRGSGGGGASVGRAPSGYRWASGGSLEPIPGGPADPATRAAGAPTLAEQQAGSLLEQALMGTNSMRDAIADDPNAVNPSIASKFADSIPFGLGDGMAQSLRTGPQQRFQHGSSQFAEVALRLATGAGQNEYEVKQKIVELTPQIGDKPELIEQKLAAQESYLKSLTIRAGRAMNDDQRGRVEAAVGAGRAAPQQDRPRATNPQTGEVVELVNGEWVKVGGAR